MKICGACGLKLDRTCFSNKQWQLSKQKRRCKQCVDKSTSPAGGASGAEVGQGTSEAEAEHGAGGDRHEEPRPPTEKAVVNDVVRCASASPEGQPAVSRSPVPVQIADGDGRAGETAEGATGGEEICSICLDVFDKPVQLSCGHSFCEVCLDGWHKKSKFDVHQPRNCPVCRHRAKPSKEIISRLYALTGVLSIPEEGDEGYNKVKMEQEELFGNSTEYECLNC